ncbi:MAG: hypothetical protein IJB49_03980 [Clostridia bacterium]|nr:hypothetical protein [Clostridia bacterium]
MSKRIFLWAAKALLSGVIAVAVLTSICMLYYNVPVHYDTVDGATDYRWEKNKFYSRGTEGFAWGKTNNEGYLNAIDYTESTQVDVLVMGSSHMEAYNVLQEQSTASVLGSLMPDKTVYNIGTSGHTFLVCADNLADAVNKYEPKEYVIIETAKLGFSDIQLQSAIDGNVPDNKSATGGIVELLQKNPFFRLTYSQLKNFSENAEEDVAPATPSENTIGSEETYSALFARLNDIVSEKGAQLIIVYHPYLILNKDGTATTNSDKEECELFAAGCEKNGIIFLDMSNRFLENYENESILPHGFTNTSIGSGHLNKNGHKMIAESLYEIMKEAK